MAIVKVKLSHATGEYLEHLEARGMREATVRANKAALTALIRSVGDIYVHNLSAEHMDRLFGSTNWGASTRNTRRGLYRTFLAWARNRQYCRHGHDPLLGWRNLRVPERDKLRIPVQEWGRLFSQCDTPIKRVTISLGLYLFLRSSEISQIQVQHIDLENRTIHIHRVKTSTRDEMPICAELEEELRDYLRWYATRLAAQGQSLTGDHYLVPVFVRGSNRREEGTHRYIPNSGTLNPDRAHSRAHLIVQEVLRDAGYSDQMQREGVHTLRRSGARAYFDALVDRGYDGALRRVQSMLGHGSATVTETYLGIRLDREQRNRELSGQPMFPGLKATGASLRAVGQ